MRVWKYPWLHAVWNSKYMQAGGNLIICMMMLTFLSGEDKYHRAVMPSDMLLLSTGDQYLLFHLLQM